MPATPLLPPSTPNRAVRWAIGLSSALLRAERAGLTALMSLMVLLILANVVTRYSGIPVYWIDPEAALANTLILVPLEIAARRNREA